MPRTLPQSIIIALGLSAGCDACTTKSPVPDAPEAERPVQLGPCLEVIPEADTAEPRPPTRVGPCLKVIPREDIEEPRPSMPEPEPASPSGEGHGVLEDARERVLARGVLPADVVAMLKRRQG